MKLKGVYRLISFLLTGILIIPMISSCSGKTQNVGTDAPQTGIPDNPSGTTTSQTQTGIKVTTNTQTPVTSAVKAEDIIWPQGQIFPTFPEGDGKIDVIMPNILSNDEQMTFAAFQGIVNSSGIKFAVYYDNVKTWAKEYGYSANAITTVADRYEYVKDHLDGISGVVIYSAKQYNSCNDYLNLAASIASAKKAIPISDSLYKKWKNNGIDLPIVEDLTSLTYTKRADVYQYFYDNYWKDSTKRLLIVQSPSMYQMRDYAAASGAAIVYLSCAAQDRQEKALFEKFCADMTPGESILMGWNGQERELMTTIAAHGLSCVPADHFASPSIFAKEGMDVRINAVPDMPELENKIYVAFYFSDGDNIQYNMNAMKEYWDNSKAYRGKIPINWTISPALLDVAPGILNYYYEGATEKECFVCGPSGLGYTFPMNTFGPNVGLNFKSEEDFTAYVKMTDEYLARTGLRTVTIWDNLSKMHKNVYTKYASYLYGLTVHNFTNANLALKYTSVNNNILTQQLTPGYFAKNAEGTTTLMELADIENAIAYLRYDGTKPVFVACQVSVWAFHDVSEVINYEKYLSNKYKQIYGKDVVEFVRADHYYNLYYKANGIPYDLTLEPTVSASASSGNESAKNVLDGTPETLWEAADKGEQSITLDLAGNYSLDRISVYLAGMEGDKYSSSDNAVSFKIEASKDGKEYSEVKSVENNTSDRVSFDLDGAEARYLKITVTDPGISGIARIADLDVFGVAR